MVSVLTIYTEILLIAGRGGESSPSGHSVAVSLEYKAPNEIPVLLQRAVGRVKEMGNGEEAVWALVPNTGHTREGMQITRGDIQRVLHGLGEADCTPCRTNHGAYTRGIVAEGCDFFLLRFEPERP